MNDPLAGLRPVDRRRLDAFGTAFAALDASFYMSLADASRSEVVDRAKAEAVRLLGTGSRQRAVRAAVAAFIDAASVAYAGRMSLPDTVMLFQSLPDRPEDRVRFLASVERAIVALVLWDELSEDDREALAGLWATRVESAVVAAGGGT